jgi:uncharacterized SAM-binding protein YcdF (DUF218 family)
MLADDPKAMKSDESGQLRPASSLRRTIRVTLIAFVLGAIGLMFGFVWFVERLPMEDSKLNQPADGIVVLTGRAARISDAVELLASRHGRRLLITGVYPTTTANAIARLVPENQHWVSCCVDLDHSAVNTSGNAVQTRIWAKKNDIKSLIVVTSNYHMPRALTELAHQLPDVALIPYPINTDRVHVETWWTNATSARLLFAEYLKYLRAVVRTQTPFVISRPASV